ncbi:YgaP family membrane protein [Microvirga rosea]|uniref:YgaP family membrane protein n=1 Tax=Microvirga rosea TaxID=2715425 RepID=UPI001D09E1FC|nr:DUF2892 domain-containing protein [Microvirga rosea]MCB8822825.1 DUF2892 domain-containing protein [Microvirga rosea]
MIYRKNLYSWEQVLRVIVGLAAAAGGIWMWPGSVVGYAVAACGVMFAVTGIFGFCPACAMIGRRPVEQASRD